jgi:hypothetical protein
MKYCANDDTELCDWLHWVSEGGAVPSFVRAVAQAAFLADLRHYALLRPVLLELAEQNPRFSA